MTLLRTLLLMFGSWVGGVWVACTGFAVAFSAGGWTALFAALSVTLAATLAFVLWRDRRAGRLA